MSSVIKLVGLAISAGIALGSSPTPEPNLLSPNLSSALLTLRSPKLASNPPFDSVRYLQAQRRNTFTSVANNIGTNITLAKTRTAAVENVGGLLSVNFHFPGEHSFVWQSPDNSGAILLYEGRNYVTVPIPRSDGSISISNVLFSKRSGSRFKVLDGLSNLCLPKKAKNSLSHCLYLAPAWAMDSAGNRVPSNYEMSGHGLYQRINTTGLKPTYPIVTQALLGSTFIARESWMANPPVGPTLSIVPSPFGRIMGFLSTYPAQNVSLATFDLIGSSAAWLEVVQKGQSRQHVLAKSGSMHIQFLCHYFYVSKIRPDKGSWNLDLARPETDLATAVRFRCNPPQ